VLSEARTQTQFLDSPSLREVLKRSDFRLRDLKSGILSVFLCLPTERQHHVEQRGRRRDTLRLRRRGQDRVREHDQLTLIRLRHSEPRRSTSKINARSSPRAADVQCGSPGRCRPRARARRQPRRSPPSRSDRL
jgi:hypothetical protein